MGVLKDIKAIKEQITDFNNTTLKRANELDENKKLLSNIKLSVKKASIIQDQTSRCYKVHIEYNIPSADIILDEENNDSQNLMVRSINLLGLISFEDQVLLSRTLEKAKEKNAELWKKE